MRERITVQSPASTRDSAGQPVSTWNQTFQNVPADWHVTGGGTNYRGQQLAENIVAVFIVRFREGYDASQRILHNGKLYGITLVKPTDGGRRYAELLCRAIPSEASA